MKPLSNSLTFASPAGPYFCLDEKPFRPPGTFPSLELVFSQAKFAGFSSAEVTFVLSLLLSGGTEVTSAP